MEMTILHMRLMFHYHCHPYPYLMHDQKHANSEATVEYRQWLINNGLLTEATETDSGYAVTDKGRLYIARLKAVQP